MAEWDPELYLAFEKGRTQPSVDLVARIDLVAPARVVDVGCGPGNSTAVLAGRWPTAETVGVDSSAAMLDKARATYPQGTWVQADATAGLGHLGTFDVVFSNAVIQWIPDQATLLRGLFALLRPGGVLAVQVPNTAGMPIRTVLEELLSQPRWRGRFDGVTSTYPHPASFYYDVLSPLTAALDLWTTDYLHVMPSHDALVQWYSGSALRPYLDHLTDDAERAAFLAEYHDQLVPAYPPQPDGNVLFPFHRIFFTARAVGPANDRGGAPRR
ncbi:MAG: methyltransferase domain-containing protein [Micrococcales bacterium]|nr:methyltransferase domain-containing protein [Micrococcales bacterium]